MFRYPIDQSTELRLLQLRHAHEMSTAVDANRQHLRQWLPWVDGSRTPADSRAFISSQLDLFARDLALAVGIWHEGALAGVISLMGIDWTNRHAAIGYWLGESFQGKGIMTRACRALVEHAFRDLRLRRVEIRCAAENLRSRAIPERLGFRNEGTVRQVERLQDRWVDHVVYAALSDEWR